jgi:NAD(P)-dependent dehydrogenase (short-subunit alcohol dehydrogenase family)
MAQSKVNSWFGLDDVACVLAGSEGLIGQAVKRALRECGAVVYAIDRDVKDEDDNHRRVDITNESELNGCFSWLTNAGVKKREYAFINCSYPRSAAWPTLGFENFNRAEFDANLTMHLGSAFHFSQSAIEFLRSRELSGSLINLGSIYGVVGPNLSIYDGTSMQNPVAYAAIKSGIIGLTKYCATVFGGRNVRANVVCPGGVENGQNANFVKNYAEKTPLGRMATPEDVAGSIAFLVGPSGKYISGQVLMVDGGWTAW